MYKIYRLLLNNEVVYIGQTKSSLLRRKNGRYREDIKEIVKKCIIELIEETDDISRERYWIEYYLNEGCELLNRRGGDGRTQKEWRDERVELKKEYDKKYRENNKDYYKLKVKEWALNNKESRKESSKKYRENNKEKIKIRNKYYRDLKKSKQNENEVV